MTPPSNLIRKTCIDGARHWYWTGVCKRTGMATWSFDRAQAAHLSVVFADAWLLALRKLDRDGGRGLDVVAAIGEAPTP